MAVIFKLKYLLLTPFLILIVWTASWGLSDVFAQQAKRYEFRWLEAGGLSSQEDWLAAKSWLELARLLNSENPNHLEMMGRLYNWRLYIADSPIESFEEQQRYINKAAEQLRLAIGMRPTWPFAWSQLLEIKSLGGQIDDEYWLIWEKSLELGPWEPLVQARLLESGLAYWEAFNEQQRQKVVKVFSDMLSKPYSAPRALHLVQLFEVLPSVCGMIDSKRVEWTKAGCSSVDPSQSSDG